MKQPTKKIKKLSCGNAIILFSLMSVDSKNYENQHEAQLQAITVCGELSLDIAAFCFLSKIADS